MNFVQRILSVITRIATEFKNVRSTIGNLSGLQTTDKTSVVNAVNEVKTSQGALINDSATTALNSTLSANAIKGAIATAKSEVLGGADDNYATLKKIETMLQNDDTALSAILSAVGGTVRFDQAQNLTAGQKAQAVSNIGVYSITDIGDINTDYVAAFNAALQ